MAYHSSSKSMLDAHGKDIFGEGTFDFIIENKTVTLHCALVALASDPLQSLMSGAFAEGIDRKVRIDNVDHDTFHRFAVWLYRGTYEAAPPSIRKRPRAGESDTSSEANGPNQIKKGVTLVQENLSGQTSDHEYAPVAHRHSLGSILPPRVIEKLPESGFKEHLQGSTASINESTHPKVRELRSCLVSDCKNDYTPVFLCHARLYVFADQWQIGELKDAALGKLERALTKFVLWDGSLPDLVNLFRYVYANTVPNKLPYNGQPRWIHLENLEPLRKLIIAFVVHTKCEDMLIKDPVVQDLMQDHRDFLGDVMWSVGHRFDDFRFILAEHGLWTYAEEGIEGIQHVEPLSAQEVVDLVNELFNSDYPRNQEQ